MPQILILADSPSSTGEVVYRERVASSDLESQHFSGQLLERINWAVGDAQIAERRSAVGVVDGHTGQPLSSRRPADDDLRPSIDPRSRSRRQGRDGR